MDSLLLVSSIKPINGNTSLSGQLDRLLNVNAKKYSIYVHAPLSNVVLPLSK